MGSIGGIIISKLEAKCRFQTDAVRAGRGQTGLHGRGTVCVVQCAAGTPLWRAVETGTELSTATALLPAKWIRE